MAAFNSPVWFNVGFEEHPQCSACFILSVEDTMESILDWNTKEGKIFRGGSGSGINLSNIRASMEHLSKGGTASGPVSFMRGADSWAGTIKSGGKTRRAAKMVVLDIDHPDVLDFIWCKAKEEEKANALRDAGFDMSIDGDGFTSIQYQNANNSVRVSDEFMERAERGEDWEFTARADGSTVSTEKADDVLRQIADAAWRCADPGVQYDTIINDWHTCPNSGRINASNPCSEYMHVDDSACNLASINLMKFRREDGTFDTDAFEHTVDVLILAQEIVVSPSSYPTEEIGDNARAFRQLGLGYANLGALLMSNGLPYDSDEGRAMAGAITALMTGRAYRKSAEVAAAMGPYDRYELNREPHNHVMRKHRDAAWDLSEELIEDRLLASARRSWDEAVELGEEHGYRNAQATVLAPTGTISFLMDCDTTGIEPDFSLVKFKELVGGGNMTIVNQTVPKALETLGYTPEQVEQIEAHIARARHDRRRPRAVRGAHAGVRRGRRRAGDQPHGPREDDGRGAAVPLRRDLQDGEPAGRGHDRGRRRDLHAGLEARPEGAGDLPRRLEDRAGAAHRGAGRRSPRAEDQIADARSRRRWPPRRPGATGCRRSASRSRTSSRSPGTRATSRPACTRTARRRDLPHRRGQGGLDAARHDERVRDVGLDRAPVRRAARDPGAQVQLHALRPGGHHRQPGDPVREVDAGLHHALAGLAASWTRICRRSWGSSRLRCGRRKSSEEALLRGDTAGPPANGGNGHTGNGGNGGAQPQRRPRRRPPSSRARPRLRPRR